MKIAVVGGGPTALFFLRNLLSADFLPLSIDIFEKNDEPGKGMPYSNAGALPEHVTNVSSNEIPDLPQSLSEWLAEQPESYLQHYDINPKAISEYRVVPRLLFGDYLNSQFLLLKSKLESQNVKIGVHTGQAVSDVEDIPGERKVVLHLSDGSLVKFDHVLICTGHIWPLKSEGQCKNYFDSPYPPAKLRLHADFPVALRGASLTAIDAMRTLALANGSFRREDGKLIYTRNEQSSRFSIVMHSIGGLLPALRFHLEHSHIGRGRLLSQLEINAVRDENNGFLPLDMVFEKAFKEPLKEEDPVFYNKISAMTMEEFVTGMMDLRENLDPILLLKAEMKEAEKSIRSRSSIHWKEMLGVLSFVMNYPAKYFSAEDMMRLSDVLKPLISIVIAYIPQSSAEEILALWEAGALSVKEVDGSSRVIPQAEGGIIYQYGECSEVRFKLFVDCVGQPAMSFEDIPLHTLKRQKVLSGASVRFRDPASGSIAMEKEPERVFRSASGDYFMRLPGVKINDNFQVLDYLGAFNDRIYMITVPYIAGYNPDYSGLDFSEESTRRVVRTLFS